MPSGAAEVQNDVDVGERLRAIRNRRRLTLREVADRAGLSESFLSQVERGRASASIASLRRIADGLGIAISDLFQPLEPTQARVLRRADRPTLAFGILGRKMLLTPKPLHELETGDSIDYRSSTPHRISNAGEDAAEVMWIISPPSY